MLELVGSRKNIIFCEGENGNLDSTVYQLVYPNYHIIPRGSGSKVIEGTKAFRSSPSLHHLSAFGIIDSDYKEQDEIDALKLNDVHTISVAEIENLFCIEPILRIVASHLGFDENTKVNEVVDFLVDSLKTEFDTQVSSKAEKIIGYKLSAFSKESDSEQGLSDALNTTMSRIDIHTVYENTKSIYQEAIDNKDINSLLKIYNRKSLLTRISRIYGLNNGEYEKLLIRLLKGSQKESIISELKTFLPDFT